MKLLILWTLRHHRPKYDRKNRRRKLQMEKKRRRFTHQIGAHLKVIEEGPAK